MRGDDVDELEAEVRGADVLDVLQRARLEVVDADDAMPAAQELVAQMRSQEPRATGHKAGGHGLRLQRVRQWRARAALSCFFVASGEITTNPLLCRVASPRTTSRLATTGQRLQRGLLLQQPFFGLKRVAIRRP